MKIRLVLLTAMAGLLCSPLAISAQVSAEIDSSQYVTILNLLSDPGNKDYTMSDVTVNYYDSLGKCWGDQPIRYSTDNTAGAGGHNGCKYYAHVGGINKIEIYPTKTDAAGNQYYANNKDITIEHPDQLYSVLLIKQNTPPVFDSASGLISKPGTLTVDRYVLKTQTTKTK